MADCGGDAATNGVGYARIGVSAAVAGSARRSLAQIEASLSFVHQANIERYKSLLKTDLSDGDRLLIRGNSRRKKPPFARWPVDNRPKLHCCGKADTSMGARPPALTVIFSSSLVG